MTVGPLIRQAFIEPESVLGFSQSEWDLLIRQARRANVLARLSHLLDSRRLLERVPDRPGAHLRAARIHAERFRHSLHWELACIERALQALDVPLVLLKGTAYALADNQAARGRMFSDIDLMAPEARLPEVEQALIRAGWMTSTFDAYDHKYYRQWMHEIPPLRHLKRQTSLDVHHNILPKTCKSCPDADRLFDNSVRIPGKNFRVFAPEDRVLHSAAHLFHEGELNHGFRDISDIDLLLREFLEIDGFWQKLLRRSVELNQQRALFYACRYAGKILATPVPVDVQTVLERQAPGKIRTRLMDFLFIRALMPNHASCNDQWTGLVRWLLFVRSHWLRMPVYLLVPHLLRKGSKRLAGERL